MLFGYWMDVGEKYHRNNYNDYVYKLRSIEVSGIFVIIKDWQFSVEKVL